jgi:hypothetical protein
MNPERYQTMALASAAARQAVDLLETLRQQGRLARAALETNDFDGLDDALEGRDRVMERTGRVLAALSGWQETLQGSGSRHDLEELESLLERVAASAEGLRKEDEQLRVTLLARRQQVERELDQLENEESVITAYGQRPQRDRGSIDVVR